MSSQTFLLAHRLRIMSTLPTASSRDTETATATEELSIFRFRYTFGKRCSFVRSVNRFGLRMSHCEQGYHQRWKGCEKSGRVAARLRKDLRNESITSRLCQSREPGPRLFQRLCRSVELCRHSPLLKTC